MSIAQINGRALLPLNEAGQILGVGEKTIRNQLVRGTFPIRTVKIGRRRLVVVEDLLRYISVSPAEAGSTAQPESRRGRGRPRKTTTATGGEATQ